MTQKTKMPVTNVAVTDLSEMLDPEPGSRMALPGFDAEFVDFPDYIIRITHRIWHDDYTPDGKVGREKEVELCRRYYAEDCLVHTQAGDVRGVQVVVDGTFKTLEGFPDRVLDADSVVWSEDGPSDDEWAQSDNPVFYSSHRITSKMTNLGDSEFGPATGKKIRVRTIADCACRDNVIFEEWLARDNGWAAMQLGRDPDELAREQARADVDKGFDFVEVFASNRAATQAGAKVETALPASPESEPEKFARHLFRTVWTDKELDALPELYDFRAGIDFPNGRDFYGHDELAEALRELFAAMPDLVASVDHVAAVPYLGEAVDVAVRWSVTGTHTGPSGGGGLYGEPTGAELWLLGISHFRLIRGRIREEWTVWDDLAFRRQVEGARLRG